MLLLLQTVLTLQFEDFIFAVDTYELDAMHCNPCPNMSNFILSILCWME